MSKITKKILIVDDEEDLCYFLKKNIETLGDYEVKTINDPRKGLSEARSYQPHLILLDILMPGVSGLELLKGLKESEKTAAIPVVMLTAKRDMETKREAASLYDEAYLEKPVEIEVLKQKIESVLARF